MKNGVFVAVGQRLMLISYPMRLSCLVAFLSNRAEIDFVRNVTFFEGNIQNSNVTFNIQMLMLNVTFEC